MIEEIFAPLLITEWGKRLGLAVAMLGALMFLVFTGQTIISLKSDLVKIHTPVKIAPLNLNTQNEAIQQIPTWHLFGNYSASASVPESGLQLHLIGIVQSENEAESRVIMAEGDNPGKVYHVGDLLPGNVKVYAITKDRVVLQNAGELEKLQLPRPTFTFAEKPKTMLHDSEES